jgi:cobalt-zinc-cadmium efflux system outer membrane protein
LLFHLEPFAVSSGAERGAYGVRKSEKEMRLVRGFKLTAIVLLLLIVATAMPAASAQIALDQALSLGLRNNPDLAAVSRELMVAHGEIVRANYPSQFNPSIDTEGDYRIRWNSANSQDWHVGLAQELEIFGQKELRRESASLGYERTKYEVQDRVRMLKAAIKLTYFDAQRARGQLELFRELQNLNARLLKTAQIRFAAGEIGQIDANLARVRFGESRRAAIQAAELYRINCSSLGRLLGGVAGPQPEPVATFPPMTVKADLETLITLARANRPDLKAATIEIARLKTEAELNRRLAMPNPTIGAFGGHELNSEYLMGGSVGFPIPLFNRRQAEATIIAGRLAQAQDLMRARQLDVEREVRDAYFGYAAARQELEVSSSDVVGPARESFNLLEEAFLAGKMDLLTLSVAERQASEARMSYIDAWFNVARARTMIEMATGVDQ